MAPHLLFVSVCLLLISPFVPLTSACRSPASDTCSPSQQASDKFTTGRCRCLSSQTCWPSQQAWEAFNSSVDGRLISVRPPAAPCHTSELDQEACQTAMEKWNNPFWRADQPGAMQASNWETSGDQRCHITSNASTCAQGAVPLLVLSALTPSHVQAGLKFASQHNLRLVVKNTGHSYLGTSTAPGSFGLWLHQMKSMAFSDRFIPEGCPAGVNSAAAVTVGAGVQWEEVYLAAAERNFVIAGGACSSIGAAGGHPQAGGHSALSPLFGLVADNVLQYQVVTADGRLLVVNACQNPELFWALRGGGGGTFGVVVSATHKLHPPLAGLVFTLYNFTATDTPSFESLVAKFLEVNPKLSDAGWSGYFRISGKSLVVNYLLPNGNVSFANQTLAPLMSYVEERAGSVEVTGLGLLSFPSFEEWRLKVQCGGAKTCFNATGVNSSGSKLLGQSVVLASRLIPRTTLEDDPAGASAALVKLSATYRVSGNFVAGGRVTQFHDNSVNPAWRRALILLILGSGWDESATLSEQAAVASALTQANRALRNLTPGSGTYMNEADFNEPDWQNSFFGDNYPRLYSIKQKVDPNGLFVCRHCVGSEDWSQDLNCKIK